MFPTVAVAAACLAAVVGLFLLLWFWPRPDIRGDVVCAVSAVAALGLVQAFGGGPVSMGLGSPAESGFLRLIGTALAICLSVYVAKAFVIDLILVRLLGWREQPFEVQAHFRNRGLLARGLVQSLYASTSEELLFRGFMQSATLLLASALVPAAAAGPVSIVGPALLFGLCHRAQGPTGVATATLVGLVFGCWFLALGQTLWPLILAHVLINMLTDVLLYLVPPDMVREQG